jgi:glutamate--cysteine ligase
VTAELLERDLRDRVFRPGSGPERIGAEVEMLVLDADTLAPVPICAPGRVSSLPLLRRFAARRGWREALGYGGPGGFLPPEGGVVSWEPGGQIEYSAPPCTSVTALLGVLRGVVLPLRAWMADHGLELRSVGIDPTNHLASTRLQLSAHRYVRMDEYLAAIGPAGPRMMRQTASLQVNLDWGTDPDLRWRTLNALAPYLTAIFANSPDYAGEPAGHQSFRAHSWRELDPLRTGILGVEDDPVGEYLRFALNAPAILLDGADDSPFHALMGEATQDHWWTHLTTLFPEVRPKGYVEVRSLDAVPPEWYAAPLALLAGIALHRASLLDAADLLRAPDAALLVRAGQVGLRDPAIQQVACDLWEIAFRGCSALGESFIAPSDLEQARAFRNSYTCRGRSPADDRQPTLSRLQVS